MLQIQNPGGGANLNGTLNGASDAFILKFDNSGIRQWGSYYGGSGIEEATPGTDFITYDNLVIDNCGNVFASFETTSTDITTKSSCDGGYYDNSYNGSVDDIFITNFSNTGILLWASYLGGNGQDFRSALALDNNGSLFVSGETVAGANTFPFTNPGGGAYYDNNQNQQQEDLYIAKFNKLPLAISSNGTNAGCTCTGSASAIVTAGCPPYNYVWNQDLTHTTYADAPNISGVYAGPYHVEVTDAAGKQVYPGLILPTSNLGLIELSSIKASNDVKEIGDMNPNIRSIVAYNTDSKVINTLRSNGILAANVIPQGDFLAGSSSIVQLDAWTSAGPALQSD